MARGGLAVIPSYADNPAAYLDSFFNLVEYRNI
jgi:hypothetical protein